MSTVEKYAQDLKISQPLSNLQKWLAVENLAVAHNDVASL